MITGKRKQTKEEIQKIISDKIRGDTFMIIENSYDISRSTIIYHLKKYGYYNDRRYLLSQPNNTLTYRQKVYKFIKITNYNIFSSGGLSYIDAVEKQQQIEDGIKSYEDYIIAAYKRGEISQAQAEQIIKDYFYNKHRSLCSYTYIIPENNYDSTE